MTKTIQEQAEALSTATHNFILEKMKEGHQETNIGFAMCGAGMAAIANVRGEKGLLFLRVLLDDLIKTTNSSQKETIQ